MAKMKKIRGAGQKAQNAVYKAENRRDRNKLAKLERYTAKNPSDSQAAEAFVDLFHKING